MKNILLILQREYLVRVKKKSFIVMTILTPLLFVLFYAGIIWTAIGSTETKQVTVLDESGLMKTGFKDSKALKFVFTDSDIETAKSEFEKGNSSALLHIPDDIVENPDRPGLPCPRKSPETCVQRKAIHLYQNLLR